MGRPTRESLLEELRTLAARHGPNVTVFTFRQETGIAPYYIYDRWGNWTNLRRAAGLPVRSHPGPVYSDDELLQEYHRTAVNVDDYPTHAEFNRLSDRCFQTLETRFGNTEDVHHQYREWLAAHCPGESPKFLEGCPAGFEPTAVPGLNIIDEAWLRRVTIGVGLWLLMVLTDGMATKFAAGRGRANGKPSVLIPTQSRIHAMAWHPNGEQLAIAGETKTVELYDVESGRQLRAWADHTKAVRSLAWSSEGKSLASVGYDNAVVLYDPTAEEPIRRLADFSQPIAHAEFWPDDAHLLTAFKRGGGDVRATATGTAERAFGSPSDYGDRRLLASAFNGESQLTATADGTLTIQVLKSGADVVIPGRAVHYSSPTWNYSMPPVAWSPVASTVAFGTPNVTGHPHAGPSLWNLGGGELVRASAGGNHFLVVSLAWSADGTSLASGGSEPETKVWNARLEKLHALSTGGWVPAVAFARDGARLAVGNQGGGIAVWNAQQGTKEADLVGHKNNIAACEWSPNGKQLASASYDGTVIIWDVEEKKPARTFSQIEEGRRLGELHSLDWSPDGRSIAAGTDSLILVWDAESGKIVHQLKSGGWIYSLCFSHDSTRLASGDGSRHGIIWDMQTGKALHRLPHPSNVWSVTWSADDSSLACSSNNHVHVWNTQSGAPRMELIPLGIDSGLALTLRGDFRVSTSLQDELVCIVQTATGQQMLTLEQFATQFGWTNHPDELKLTAP